MKYISALIVFAAIVSGPACHSGGHVDIPYVSKMVAKALPPATLKTQAVALHSSVLMGAVSAQALTQGQTDLDNVMGVFWNQKTGSPCSSADVSAGNCFTSSTGTQFYKPTPLLQTCDSSMTWTEPSTDPTQIIDNSALQKSCEMDQTVDFARSSMDQCSGSKGASFDIGYFIPWYASWGIPQTDTFDGASGPVNETGPIQDYKWFKFQTASDFGFAIIDLQPANRVSIGYRNQASNNFFYVTVVSNVVPSGTVPGLSAFVGQAPNANGTLSGNSFETYYVNRNRSGVALTTRKRHANRAA